MTAPGMSMVTTGAPPNDKQQPLFDAVSYALASQLLGRAQLVERCVRGFVEGDHWQRGDGWMGPRPSAGETGYATVMGEIERAFVSYNVVAEILERHMTGVVGKEPVWSYTPRRPIPHDGKPTDKEQSLVDEVQGYVTTWWDDRKVHRRFQSFVKKLLWAQRATLRLFIPVGMTEVTFDEATGEQFLVAKASSFEEALSMLFLEDPEPEDATVFIDPSTQRWLGITSFPLYNNHWVVAGPKVLELTYLTDDGDTVIKRISPSDAQEFTFPLGGRLTLWESLRVSPLITSQIIAAQKALNLAISMLPRNVVTGGFLERVLLNAQMPGEWILDAKGQRVGFKPSSYRTGAGTTNFLQGTEYKDEAGNTRLMTPDIKWRPASETTPTTSAADFHYIQALREGKQTYVLANAEAGDSGWSKEQARADYATSLDLTIPDVQDAGRWLLETVVAWAEVIWGHPGYYTETLKAVVQCRKNTGPLSVEERAQNMAEADKNLIAIETAMERNGVDDTAAEQAKITKQSNANQNLLTWQATTLDNLVAAGFPLEIAAELLGMDAKIVQKLADFAATPPPQPEPTPNVPAAPAP